MCKCNGCGIELQTQDFNKIGYTKSYENKLCERCFRIRNYNEYRMVVKDNNDYINILRDINKTSDLVVLVVDLFNISPNLNDISKYINNNILLVLTKRDILPKSCYDKNLLDYFDEYNLKTIDKVIISSKKNYNFDYLYDKINNYKTSNNVYVVGFTNSGKSSMINKIIYNYSNSDSIITTSNLPSTTLDSIHIKINDELNLIDTPGLLDSGDIINYIDCNELKKVIPNKEIKPITYQVKGKQRIYIDSLAALDIFDSNVTIYMSNNLNIKRCYSFIDDLSNYEEKEIFIGKNYDLVIDGLGFISFKKDTTVNIYVIPGVNVFTRKSLI